MRDVEFNVYLRDYGPEGLPRKERALKDRALVEQIEIFRPTTVNAFFERRFECSRTFDALFCAIVDSCVYKIPLVIPDLAEFRHRPDVLRMLRSVEVDIYVGKYPNAPPEQIKARLERWIKEAEETAPPSKSGLHKVQSVLFTDPIG